MTIRVTLVMLVLLAAAGAKKPTDDTSNPAYSATPVVLTADKSGKPAKPAGFIHPGVLVNRAQLGEMKKRVASGIEPQKSAFEQLKRSKLGALDYTPHPRETVECGSYSKPDLGCKTEQADSEAAFAQALLWSITGNSAYAENSIKIMNAWSSTLTGGHTNANGPVQASWTGDVWPRAAEIIRYTYTGWPDADIAKFQNMLTTQYLPSIIHGTCENGNKELTMSEALINIGVFNDNRTAFDLGLKMWRGRAPAYIYLKTDGPKPVEPPGCGPALWGNKSFTPQLTDGLLQESARDSGHANLGLAGMVDAAETARQQGVDLYAEQGKRIMAALEFQAQYLPPNNATPPQPLEFHVHPTWEIAYKHFHGRRGYSLPKMSAVLPTIRPTGVNHHMNWETLTHAGMGAVGLGAVVQRDGR
jgi:Alginate lyase